jgi:PIN domain nuclease of toxin-antitoxin system
MRLLIDTQIFIWAVLDSEHLNVQARRIMTDATEVFVSSASLWEIAIKAKLGKLAGNPNEFVEAVIQSGFQEIVITMHHAAKTYDLPSYHRDPFDRLLIAQAICEPMKLLTADKMLARYTELVITV